MHLSALCITGNANRCDADIGSRFRIVDAVTVRPRPARAVGEVAGIVREEPAVVFEPALRNRERLLAAEERAAVFRFLKRIARDARHDEKENPHESDNEERGDTGLCGAFHINV